MLLHGRKLADTLQIGRLETYVSGWKCLAMRPSDRGGWAFPLEGPGGLRVTLTITPHGPDRPHWRRIGGLSLTYSRTQGEMDRIMPVLEALAATLETEGLPPAMKESVHALPSLLTALFSLDEPDPFFQHHWGIAPLHVTGSLPRLGELSTDPLLASWETLREVHTGETIGTWVAENGDPTEEALPREQLMDRRNEGWVTTLLHVERDVPVVDQWCHALADALGTAPGSVRCASFSALPGRGVCKHWDADDLILIQLRGTKRWRIAPNTQLEHPTSNCLPPHVSREIQRYSKGVFDTKMPTDATSITLQAGDALYLPRGMWHATEDSEEGLSLSFAISRPSWMDVILEALEDLLIQNPAFREAAESRTSLDKVRELLSLLGPSLDNLDPEQILQALTKRRR